MPEHTVLGINAKYLKQLADAIGDEDGQVTLFIPPHGNEANVDKAIAVRGINGIGVIMPVAIQCSRDVLEYRDRFETIRRAYTIARNAAHQPKNEAVADEPVIDEPAVESEPVAAAA